MPFKPGQSGNPKGKPPGLPREIAKLKRNNNLYLQETLQAVAHLGADELGVWTRKKERTTLERALGVLMEDAIDGNDKQRTFALNSFLDRMYGKPQNLELALNDVPIQMLVEALRLKLAEQAEPVPFMELSDEPRGT